MDELTCQCFEKYLKKKTLFVYGNSFLSRISFPFLNNYLSNKKNQNLKMLFTIFFRKSGARPTYFFFTFQFISYTVFFLNIEHINVYNVRQNNNIN